MNKWLKDLKFIFGQPLSLSFVGDNEGGSGNEGGTAGDFGVIADLDLSDIPENLRESMKPLLAKKAKDLQRMTTKKQEELAKKLKEVEGKSSKFARYEGIIEELDASPELARQIESTYKSFKGGSPTQRQMDNAVGTIDDLIKNAATPNDREQLRQLKDMVEGIADVGGTKKQLKEVSDQLKQLQDMVSVTQQSRVEGSITSLKDRFGEVVDDYEDEIRKYALNNPRFPAEKIFLQVAKEEDIRKAYRHEDKEQEKKRKVTIEPSGAATRTKTAPTFTKGKGGRVDTRSIAKAILGRK